MMCGGCVSRVKSLLSADDRVDSAVVNMLTETAAVKLKPEVAKANLVAESLAQRLTECGFPTKRRVSGMGVTENVKKWKENMLLVLSSTPCLEGSLDLLKKEYSNVINILFKFFCYILFLSIRLIDLFYCMLTILCFNYYFVV
jgi:cation transport ATPase